jgi:circadian clock protein KaiC
VSRDDRVSFGVAGLDALLDGGVPRLSTSVVEGGTGVGKTLLGLHFLIEGARRGEPGLLLTLEEAPDQLRAIGQGFGWDLAAIEQAGMLRLHHASPVELSPDAFLHTAREILAQSGARRVVLDSLTSVELSVSSKRRFRELIYAMSKHVRAAEATLLMTLESQQLVGAGPLTSGGISPAADNVILLRYVEVDGVLQRAVSVLKARGIEHSTELRRLQITSSGAEVLEVFEGMRGVLTGIPIGNTRRTGASMGKGARVPRQSRGRR